MKKLLAIALMIPILAGCTTTPTETPTPTKQKLTWYDSREEALLKGLKKEGTRKENILETKQFGDEQLIIYHATTTQGEGIGVAAMQQENDEKFAWTRVSNKLTVRFTDGQTANSQTTFHSPEGVHYRLYIGIMPKDKKTVVINGRSIRPTVDMDTRMYYHIKKVK